MGQDEWCEGRRHGQQHQEKIMPGRKSSTCQRCVLYCVLRRGFSRLLKGSGTAGVGVNQRALRDETGHFVKEDLGKTCEKGQRRVWPLEAYFLLK